MGQAVLTLFVNLVVLSTGYWVFYSAANAILRGNVSKTRLRKIKKSVGWAEKLRLSYITPYAKRYASSLKVIIRLSRVYAALVLAEAIVGAGLLLVKLPAEDFILLSAVNMALVVPAYLYSLLASYHGNSKDWRYAEDAKNRRKGRKK